MQKDFKKLGLTATGGLYKGRVLNVLVLGLVLVLVLNVLVLVLNVLGSHISSRKIAGASGTSFLKPNRVWRTK